MHSSVGASADIGSRHIEQSLSSAFGAGPLVALRKLGSGFFRSMEVGSDMLLEIEYLVAFRSTVQEDPSGGLKSIGKIEGGQGIL